MSDIKTIKEKSEEYAYTNWESDEYHDGDEFDPIGHTQKTFEDAQKEYQQIKRATIKNEAMKLYSKHLITEKVYRALIKYSLENLI